MSELRCYGCLTWADVTLFCGLTNYTTIAYSQECGKGSLRCVYACVKTCSTTVCGCVVAALSSCRTDVLEFARHTLCLETITMATVVNLTQSFMASPYTDTVFGCMVARQKVFVSFCCLQNFEVVCQCVCVCVCVCVLYEFDEPFFVCVCVSVPFKPFTKQLALEFKKMGE